MASKEQCTNLEQQRHVDQARLVELEAQLAAVREKAQRDQEAVQREIADVQQDSANQRKAELAAVDARVRKVSEDDMCAFMCKFLCFYLLRTFLLAQSLNVQNFVQHFIALL